MACDSANAKLNLGTELKLDAADFLQRYWQKRPKLMRQALRNFACPISANDLAGLACTEGSLARIVQGTGKRFSVASGPFSDASFTGLGSSNWTLLVQEVDQWDRNVRELLKHFDFLPRWRIEDVMVSYAVRGGSVGAHVDQYDVFLLQGRGQRRWQIDDRAQAKTAARQQFLPKAKLKLLAHFTPNRDWILNPGDVLYLPPGVPHHGVALNDDCMTFSIGLRAPSATELLENFAHTQAQKLAESVRYSDPNLTAQTHPVALDSASVTRVRETLAKAIQLSDTELGAWFANFMSAYRSSKLVLPERAAKVNSSPSASAALAARSASTSAALAARSASTSAALAARPASTSAQQAATKLGDRLATGASLTLAPGMRVIQWQGALHMGGQKIICDAQMQSVLSAFSVHIDAAVWQRLSANSQALVLKLKRANALIFIH